MSVIIYRPNKPKKYEWAEWRKFCQEIYDDLEDDKHFTKLRNRDNPYPDQTVRPAAPAQITQVTTIAATIATTNGDPMELDSSGAAARREYRRLQNLCFYCGGQHPVRDCEEKNQNDAKFGRSTDLTRGGAPRGRGNRGGRGPYRGSYTTGTPTPYPAGPVAPQNVARPQPGNPWATPYYGTPANPYAYPSPGWNRLRPIEPGYVETDSVSSGHGHSTPDTDASSFVDSPTENE